MGSEISPLFNFKTEIMKNLILILLVNINTIGYSQNDVFDIRGDFRGANEAIVTLSVSSEDGKSWVPLQKTLEESYHFDLSIGNLYLITFETMFVTKALYIDASHPYITEINILFEKDIDAIVYWDYEEEQYYIRDLTEEQLNSHIEN